ncbi:hypothetical protein BD560DRAFT_419664 [Blakeslea trispora]|nr:hypothetical protein BD560DRAFT_419664 [Blakeslea trispora]
MKFHHLDSLTDILYDWARKEHMALIRSNFDVQAHSILFVQFFDCIIIFFMKALRGIQEVHNVICITRRSDYVLCGTKARCRWIEARRRYNLEYLSKHWLKDKVKKERKRNYLAETPPFYYEASKDKISSTFSMYFITKTIPYNVNTEEWK